MQENKLPIDIREILSSIKHISDIRYTYNNDGLIYLTSSNGIGKLCKIDQDGNEEIFFKALNVCGTVGYGGGGFDISKNLLVLTEKSGDIYTINLKNSRKERIVQAKFRTASPKISPDENWVIFVYDQDITSGLGISSLTHITRPRQLVQGADFYMQPTWHPNNKMIAWVEWDHPHMPWDASRIKIAHVGGTQLEIMEEQYVDGNLYSSANQPKFSPDGNWLSYIKRSQNWDDLVLFNLKTRKITNIINNGEFHLRMPDWIQGLHSYQWTKDSTTIYFIKYRNGKAFLSSINIDSRIITSIDITPFTWASQIDLSHCSNQIAFIGSSYKTSNVVVRIENQKIITPNINSNDVSLKYYPKPKAITFPTRNGTNAYAWYYPSIDKKDEEDISPCILNIHSGPTSLKHTGFSAETAILTAFGYSLVYLNYRGSVSYGYEYQYALRRKWGIAEIEDAIDLVKELIFRKLVNPHKIAVMGSSAGGFSALNLLIKYPHTFKAGICSYAVSDLVDDAKNTHKFERYYHEFLTGNFNNEKELFIDRSPISHLDKIKDPLALFHGAEDHVVSPEQSKKIFNILTKRGVPCSLTIYPNEGHGFRKLTNIENYYRTINKFLSTYLK
ncbi:MAG: S9 family peptidase [Anaerolineaceae bacterium]|nr:S9 family peptidase [Anaerolineaceae bacterium]